MNDEPQDLEAEWRERWAESGRYEADPAGKAEHAQPSDRRSTSSSRRVVLGRDRVRI